MLKRFFLSEKTINIVIVLNALVIILLSFPDLENNKTLMLIDLLFVVYVLVEITMKYFFLGRKEFFKDGWNSFDGLILLVSIPTILPFVDHMLPDTSFFLLFRMLRLARIIRLLRVLRSIPNIASLMRGLVRALKASVFVFISLVFLIFIFAVFTCYLYGDLAPEYFDDPFLASYTIFQMFTLDDWARIPKAIADHESSTPFLERVTNIYFVIIVLSGGIFGLSLANAVFVDEMTMDNNKALEDKIDDLSEQMKAMQQLLENQKS